MKNNMIPFPKIGQYRQLIKEVKHFVRGGQDGAIDYPTIKFTGTVKAHGTNAAVVVDLNNVDDQYVQSRKRVLTISSDNFGFAAWHHTKKEWFAEEAKTMFGDIRDAKVIFYGEWAGIGIQNGVAIANASRFFYIFNVKIVYDEANTPDVWVGSIPYVKPPEDILLNGECEKYTIDIDFNAPEKHQNQLADITTAVEAECPLGKKRGHIGIGEGVVWEHITNEGKRIAFKVKGEKHSSTKVRKLAKVDTEKIESVVKFVEYAVTENRLEQMFLEVCNNIPDRELIGKFIKAVSSDVAKEEIDTLCDNGLCMKDVGNKLSTKARNWFFSKEDV